MKTQSSTYFKFAAAIFCWLAAAPAQAADKSHPDWPCVQGKIESLSPTAVWDGPSIDADADAASDESIKDLVLQLTSRRVPIDQAAKAVKKYADGLAAAKKDEQLTHLFAAVFNTINSQRKTVMNGLEKYVRSQRDRSAQVQQMGLDLEKLQKETGIDDESEAKVAKAQQDYDWAARIFQERQQNITVACDIPVIMDERLGEISRAIRSNMTK